MGSADPTDLRCIAVDWSGRAGATQARHLWSAVVEGGELVELSSGRTRAEVSAWLAGMAGEPEPVVVGLDFTFGLPAWFGRARGCATAPDVWRLVSEEGEEWLRACDAPFWGRPGKRCPGDQAPPGTAGFRATELAVKESTGFAPRSAFQIGGAGAVGTGSLRGMPHLLELQRAGFAVWPFDEPGLHTVVEIYPRVLTGKVDKSDPDARARYLAQVPGVTDEFAHTASKSEDAFDAAVSALAMDAHARDLARLSRAAVGDDARLEGEIWQPPPLRASIGGYMGSSYYVEGGPVRVTYRRSERGYQLAEEREVTPEPGAWDELIDSLDAVGVWAWDVSYRDPSILDGTSWSFEIGARGRRVESRGSNAYPPGFDAACAAMSRFLGGLEFR